MSICHVRFLSFLCHFSSRYFSLAVSPLYPFSLFLSISFPPPHCSFIYYALYHYFKNSRVSNAFNVAYHLLLQSHFDHQCHFLCLVNDIEHINSNQKCYVNRVSSTRHFHTEPKMIRLSNKKKSTKLLCGADEFRELNCPYQFSFTFHFLQKWEYFSFSIKANVSILCYAIILHQYSKFLRFQLIRLLCCGSIDLDFMNIYSRKFFEQHRNFIHQLQMGKCTHFHAQFRFYPMWW